MVLLIQHIIAKRIPNEISNEDHDHDPSEEFNDPIEKEIKGQASATCQ